MNDRCLLYNVPQEKILAYGQESNIPLVINTCYLALICVLTSRMLRVEFYFSIIATTLILVVARLFPPFLPIASIILKET